MQRCIAIVVLLITQNVWGQAFSFNDLAFVGQGKPTASAPLADYTNNLALWLDYKGTNINNEIDRSTNNITMTWSAGIGYTAGPQAGTIAANPASSFLFSGTDSTTDNSSKKPYNYTNQDFTISGWFYVTSASPQFQWFAWKGEGNVSGWSALFDMVNFQIYLRSNQSGTRQDIASAAGTGPRINTWYHVAIVRSGSNVSFYTNGVFIATVGGLSDPLTSVNPLKLFTDSTASGVTSSKLAGYGADFRLFNEALTSGKVSQVNANPH